MRKLLPLLIAAACFGICAPLAAQEKSEQIKKAEDHFKKGAEYYANGEYAKAVVEFKFGHQLAPNAMFLYNMSLAYERLESYDEAVQVASDAEKMGGMPDEIMARNSARLRGFRTILRGRDVADATAKLIAEAQTDQEGDGEGDGEVETITQPDGVTTLGYVGIGLTVVGGGFAVGGLMTNIAVNRDIAEFEDAAASGDRTRYEESRQAILDKQPRGKLFYAVGAAAAGVGVTLLLIDLVVGTEEVPVTFQLHPGPDGAMAGATVRFR